MSTPLFNVINVIHAASLNVAKNVYFLVLTTQHNKTKQNNKTKQKVKNKTNKIKQNKTKQTVPFLD